MADSRVTDLTAPSGGPASGDKLYLVDVSDTTDNGNGSSRVDTINNVVGSVGALKANNLSDVTASTARTNLGLVIGTNVQAQGPTLDTLEALSLAQADLLYATAADTLTRLPKGTGLQQLRMNAGATAPEWASVGASGQTLYDRIVASSGGDHTTLGAAITASSAGDTIFVRSGTYSESAITSSLANLTIIGENPETALISMGANALTLSGTKVRIINCGITATTGGVTLSGNYSEIVDSIITRTGQSQVLTLSGQYTAVRDSMILDANASSPNQQMVSLSGSGAAMYNCYCECKIGSGSGQWMNCSGGHNKVIGSRFRTVNNISNSAMIASNASHNKFVGNTFQDSDNVLTPVILIGTQYALIASNVVNGGIVFVDTTSAGNVVIDSNLVLTSYNAAQAVIAPRAVVVTGNRFVTTSGGGTQTGIALTTSNASDSIIADNLLSGYDTGISVGSGVANATISGNNLRGILTTPMTDAGTATLVHNNMGANISLQTQVVRMKNTSGSTINAGNIVTFKAVAAGDEITTTTTASDNLIFGMATASIINNAYGYIQTLGKTTLLTVDGTTDIAVGDFITTFTSAGIGRKAAAGTLGTTPGDLAIAIALEAYTTNDSSGVIDALLITPRRL